MSTTAQDVWELLPPAHRIGGIEVVAVEVVDDLDSVGDDAVRVVLTLADPVGDTWPTADAQRLRALIQQGRVHAGEDRLILFTLRSAQDRDDGEPDPVQAGGPGRPGVGW